MVMDEATGGLMATITTVKAALRAVAANGWTANTQHQLASALGPATLYVPILNRPTDARQASPAPAWLPAFTTPDPAAHRARNHAHRIRFSEYTGAELLELVCTQGCGLVLEAGTDLERRIAPKTANAMKLVAAYTASLVNGELGLYQNQIPLRAS